MKLPEVRAVFGSEIQSHYPGWGFNGERSIASLAEALARIGKRLVWTWQRQVANQKPPQK